MGWNFANTSEYISCRLGGRRPVHCVWLCEWQTNTWYALTPRDQHIVTARPAAFIGDADHILGDVAQRSPVRHDSASFVPIAPHDPGYEVRSPNVADTLYVGDTLRVTVHSARSGSAILYLSLDAGRMLYALPTGDATIDPTIDSLFAFAIPDSIEIDRRQVALASDRCKILLQDYSDSDLYDESDEFFVIEPSHPVSVVRDLTVTGPPK
jgi:hypothetical protein